MSKRMIPNFPTKLACRRPHCFWKLRNGRCNRRYIIMNGRIKDENCQDYVDKTDRRSAREQGGAGEE